MRVINLFLCILVIMLCLPAVSAIYPQNITAYDGLGGGFSQIITQANANNTCKQQTGIGALNYSPQTVTLWAYSYLRINPGQGWQVCNAGGMCDGGVPLADKNFMMTSDQIANASYVQINTYCSNGVNYPMYYINIVNSSHPVYIGVNPIDIDTNSAIMSSVLGIADSINLTWQYVVSNAASYPFFTAGTPAYPLSIGQSVILSGYVPNLYVANNTPWTIQSYTSDVVPLYLKKVSNSTTNSTMQINCLDASSGSLIQNGNTQLYIQNTYSGSWLNVTVPTGKYNYTSLKGSSINLYGTSPNYVASNNYNIPVTDNTVYNMYFGQVNNSLSINQSQITYTVIDAISNAPLAGATITEVNASRGLSGSAITGPSGTYTELYTTTSNTSFTVTTTDSPNYYGDVRQVNVYTSGNQFITIPLQRVSQITPTYTAVTPTVAPTNGINGQPVNGTAWICGAPYTNIVDQLGSFAACWGITDRTAQNLALAAIIIIIFALLLAKYGKAAGAIVGASVGFIISLVAGLIPVWAFFALVIIAGLLFAVKLIGSEK
jgi:hypothetical protein